jgi:hypothetical protein
MATLLTGLWPNVRVRFLRYNNLAYAFNGRDNLQRFDGEDWNRAGFAKPSGITCSAHGSGGALTGSYTYYVTAANTNISVGDGRYVEGLPVLVGTVAPVAQHVDFVIPATGQTGQTSWVIYRNKAGDLRHFYRQGVVAVGTTTHADNTADDSLETVELGFPDGTRFPYNQSPCFKHAAIFANRMLGCTFDEYNSGHVTVNTDTTKIDLVGATFPPGVVGCYFQKVNDSARYTITARGTTTQITLDRAFVGTLSSADYVIFRDPSTLWYSEFDNMEAWGPEGETPLGRNQLLVGGRGSALRLTGCYAAHGVTYVWTDNSTFRVRGGTSDTIPLWVEPDPFLRDIGCVGSDTVVQVEQSLFWLSRKGPVGYNPATNEGLAQIGEPLGGDWVQSLGLAPAQLALCCGGYDPVIDAIKWAVPLSGKTECNYVIVYDIRTRTWWPETDWTPRFYFSDYDGDGKPKLYSVLGRQMFRESEGRTDGVPSGTQTGVVTGYVNGTKTVTCAAASFYVTDYGLEDRWAHFYTAAGVFRGKSRIDSNGATTLVLEDAISTIVATDIVYIGAPQWYWKTKTFSAEPAQQEIEEVHLRFALQGESTQSTVYLNDYIEGNKDGVVGEPHPLTVLRNGKKHNCKRRSAEYAVKVSGRTPSMEVALRSIALVENQEKKDATNG